MRSLSPAGLLLSGLVACSGGGSDKADTGLVDDSGVQDPTLTGLAELPEDTAWGAPLTVGLVRVEFGDGPLLFETLASAPVGADGSFELTWDEEAGEAAAIKPGNDHPDLLAAFYLPLVFEDVDESGSWEEGELIAGAALDRWLTWLGGHGEEPWPTGWSVVDLGLAGQYKPNRCLSDSSLILSTREDDGYPVFYELDQAVAVRLRGLPATLELGGEMTGLGEEHDRFLSLPYQAFSDEALADYDPVFDVEAADGAFVVSLSEPPPEDHNWSNDASWRYSVHVQLLYEDRDGDGAWDAEVDALTSASTCEGGNWVYGRYTWPVTDYRGLRFLDCYEGQVGWRTAYTDPDSGSSTYMSSIESLSLEVNPEECSL